MLKEDDIGREKTILMKSLQTNRVSAVSRELLQPPIPPPLNSMDWQIYLHDNILLWCLYC